MGTFGAGIYDDDEAQDARDSYREILSQGLDDEQATNRFLREWKRAMKDSDDGPVIWYALADTQWTLGRLEDRVRDEAVRLIDAEAGLDRWREAGDKALARRRKALAALREKLLSPPPKKKKIKVERAAPAKPKSSAGQPLKPAEVRSRLKAIHCTLEPSRGSALTYIACHGNLTDELLAAVETSAATLEALHISNCPALTPAGLAVIERLTKLKSLGVRNLPLTDDIIAPWGGLRHLEWIEIQGRKVTDRGLRHLAACVHLESLGIGGTSAGDATLEWARDLKSLRELWARSTRITDDGVKALRGQKTLRQVYLAGNSLTDVSLQHLAMLPNLVWLDVADTAITDAGLDQLASSPSLRALDLAGTKVTDACIPTLRSIPQLCYLNLERTKLTKAGLRQVEQEMPLLADMDARRAMQQAL